MFYVIQKKLTINDLMHERLEHKVNKKKNDRKKNQISIWAIISITVTINSKDDLKILLQFIPLT